MQVLLKEQIALKRLSNSSTHLKALNFMIMQITCPVKFGKRSGYTVQAIKEMKNGDIVGEK